MLRTLSDPSMGCQQERVAVLFTDASRSDCLTVRRAHGRD